MLLVHRIGCVGFQGEAAHWAQPRQANCAGLPSTAAAVAAVELASASAETPLSSVCLKSGLWEGDPREHELGLSGYQSPN